MIQQVALQCCTPDDGCYVPDGAHVAGQVSASEVKNDVKPKKSRARGKRPAWLLRNHSTDALRYVSTKPE